MVNQDERPFCVTLLNCIGAGPHYFLPMCWTIFVIVIVFIPLFTMAI